MLFLGTGAAELYPNPYCNCEFCESLRQSGEAPRKRSSLLLDAHTLVDLGPDALAAAQMYNARLYDVDHLFLTHSHEDHPCAWAAWRSLPSRATTRPTRTGT